jgi:hypothetical protein
MKKLESPVIDEVRKFVNASLVRGSMFAQLNMILSADRIAERRKNASKVDTDKELAKVRKQIAILEQSVQ